MALSVKCTLRENKTTIQNPDPKTYNQLASGLKEIWLTVDEFNQRATEKGYVKGYNLWKGYTSKGHAKPFSRQSS